MIRKTRKVYVCEIAFALISFVLAAQASEISYIPVPAHADSGYTEIGGTDGMARIEYHYWLDDSSGYWHYAYQVFNNDYFNTPDDRTDDYHFGYVYNSGATPDSINKFDITLDPADGIDDLLVLDTSAGSTAGGTGWAHSPSLDIFTGIYLGMDWVVAGSGGHQIAPVQWNDYGNKKNPNWVCDYAGDASTDDSSGQYFQVASKWGPDWVESSIVAGVGLQASGQVIGPSIIPEPATAVILGFGALVLLKGRKVARALQL